MQREIGELGINHRLQRKKRTLGLHDQAGHVSVVSHRFLLLQLGRNSILILASRSCINFDHPQHPIFPISIHQLAMLFTTPSRPTRHAKPETSNIHSTTGHFSDSPSPPSLPDSHCFTDIPLRRKSPLTTIRPPSAGNIFPSPHATRKDRVIYARI